VRLYAAIDARRRDSLGLRLANDVDAAAVSKCTFFFLEADFTAIWPTKTAKTRRLSKRERSRIAVREALIRLYPPNGTPPDNIRHNILYRDVGDQLKKHGKSVPSKETVLREAGLRSG
jgi:hypothetical protein